MPSGSIVIILELYEPYAATGESQKIVKAFTFSPTDIWAHPVSFPIYRSQFEIYFKVFFILKSSNENEFFPTGDLLNLFISKYLRF